MTLAIMSRWRFSASRLPHVGVGPRCAVRNRLRWPLTAGLFAGILDGFEWYNMFATLVMLFVACER
jgi:hypothetical protein